MGDDCQIRVDDIHRIQSTTQTDLQDRDVDFLLAKQVQGSKCRKLKIGQSDFFSG